MNITGLAGRIVRDPIVRATAKSKVANFTVAVTSAGDYDPSTKETNAGFFNVEAWGATAEYAEKYLTKGRMVGVSGSLKQHKWQDENGLNREQVKIVANKLQPLDGRSNPDSDTEEVEEEDNFINAESASDYDPFS
jgi:single-strand DNA-binding protein